MRSRRCLASKAFSFFLGGHAQAALKQNLHHKADDDRHYSNEHDGDKDALNLSDEQRVGSPVYSRPPKSVQGEVGHAEDAGEHAAHHAADAVAADASRASS